MSTGIPRGILYLFDFETFNIFTLRGARAAKPFLCHAVIFNGCELIINDGINLICSDLFPKDIRQLNQAVVVVAL